MRLYSTFLYFFFNDTATTEIYTLSYTTLFRSNMPPIMKVDTKHESAQIRFKPGVVSTDTVQDAFPGKEPFVEFPKLRLKHRSEEHTSELQSQSNLVCRLLLEKKKHINTIFIFH